MSVCSTWFCKHTRGALGKAFWTALRDLLATLELELSVWAALELGIGAEALAGLIPSRAASRSQPSLDAADLDGAADPGQTGSAAIWGEWNDARGHFFAACDRLISKLSWTEAERIAGSECRLRKEALITRFSALTSAEVPARCRVARFEVLSSDESSVEIVSYSDLDPLRLPRMVLDVLHRFDNADPRTVVGELEAERGIEMQWEVVQLLLDFDILVPA
jgi:hypothetical protein